MDEDQAGPALRELRDYEVENRDWPPKEVVLPLAPGALEGAIGYALFLTALFAIEQAGFLTDAWLERGKLASDLVWREPWRAVTALTLHADVPHLISNLIFGGLFGYLVALTYGYGLGWCAIVVAGFLGNLMNATVRGPGAFSVGASTAVFAAVGILAGGEARRRHLLRQRRIRRGAPILMGFLLLGYLGMGEGRVDVSAHVMGLFSGLAVGFLLGSRTPRGDDEHELALAPPRRVQLRLTLVTLVILIVSWAAALV